MACVFSRSTGSAAAPGPEGETLEQSICRLIDGSAATNALPAAYLTRLIWQESSFRPHVVSPAGAQGVAQFMPGTARARGLLDPFDPEQAIPAAAGLVADLARRFGNLGLAAAAYNAGEGRVSAWLAGTGGLPFETRDYVARITGRPADDWAAERRGNPAAAPTTPATAPPGATAPLERTAPPANVATGSAPEGSPAPPAAPAPTAAPPGCLATTAELRRFRAPAGGSVIAEGERAPWGVQLAGAFSKAVALASYARNRANLASILGDRQPMILGGRLRYRGSTTFYRVRVPAPTRAEANALCARIRAARSACVVLRT